MFLENRYTKLFDYIISDDQCDKIMEQFSKKTSLKPIKPYFKMQYKGDSTYLKTMNLKGCAVLLCEFNNQDIIIAAHWNPHVSANKFFLLLKELCDTQGIDPKTCNLTLVYTQSTELEISQYAKDNPNYPYSFGSKGNTSNVYIDNDLTEHNHCSIYYQYRTDRLVVEIEENNSIIYDSKQELGSPMPTSSQPITIFSPNPNSVENNNSCPCTIL